MQSIITSLFAESAMVSITAAVIDGECVCAAWGSLIRLGPDKDYKHVYVATIAGSKLMISSNLKLT